jgi:hypothetical protein
MLLYDHQTESLWSQIKSEAVTGYLIGSHLKVLPSTHMNWASWKYMHPITQALSANDGCRQDYDPDPYQVYETSERLVFGVSEKNRKYHPKEKVIGIELSGRTKAYPFSELKKVASPIKDVIENISDQISYDHKTKNAVIRDENNREIPSVVEFWFA